MINEVNGFTQLKKTLSGEYPNPSTLNYDEEAEFIDTLPELEYVNVMDFDTDILENQSKMRSKIRYLAALFPNEDLVKLTHRIHGLLNNTNLEVDTLRLILAGKKLSDPSQNTQETRIRIIQGIGQCLRQGMTLRATSREMKVSLDTVRNIEEYLGIRKAYQMKMIDKAVDAARIDMPVRSFSKKYNCSRTLAKRLLAKGNEILIELGETK